MKSVQSVALSDGELLDVDAVGALDDVDTDVDDARLDGLARLDGEGADGDARRVDDTHIGRMVE